ncbi:MAG: nucleotidyltransferase domain-containing protein [Prevotellaceae bacterium]|jgi:predicted nucleotidyltransferase|nr:nucleotidyltransferase domain-containing protein [Prevotellaceae bacterium]
MEDRTAATALLHVNNKSRINKTRISRLCKKHRVKRLYAFGSILTDKFNDNSDVDLLVKFDKIPIEDYADNYFNLKFSLEDNFARPVDLLEEKALKNPYLKKSINKNKLLIYG